MPRNTFEVSWAEELGIDVADLWTEHPSHPKQVKLSKRWRRRAEIYWALQLITDRQRPGAPSNDAKEVRKKYAGITDFEDWQLKIAIEALRKQGS